VFIEPPAIVYVAFDRHFVSPKATRHQPLQVIWRLSVPSQRVWFATNDSNKLPFDAGTGVAHRKIEETRVSRGSAYFDFARTSSDRANRIERVQDQIDDELLSQNTFGCDSTFLTLDCLGFDPTGYCGEKIIRLILPDVK
jgi:hypothetical protein